VGRLAPPLSQTDGVPDGRWLFINANNTPRVARIDLTRFETDEILQIPNAAGGHASPFTTPNTKYIVSATRFSVPIGAKRDVPIASYNRPEVAHRHNRKEDELDPRDCEGVVYYLPTPKSPHGVDVDPTGEYIVAGGKLATVIPVHSFTKLAKAIEAKQFDSTIDGECAAPASGTDGRSQGHAGAR